MPRTLRTARAPAIGHIPKSPSVVFTDHRRHIPVVPCESPVAGLEASAWAPSLGASEHTRRLGRVCEPRQGLARLATPTEPGGNRSSAAVGRQETQRTRFNGTGTPAIRAWPESGKTTSCEPAIDSRSSSVDRPAGVQEDQALDQPGPTQISAAMNPPVKSRVSIRSLIAPGGSVPESKLDMGR